MTIQRMFRDRRVGRIGFWLSIATVAYTYVGYPLLVWLATRGHNAAQLPPVNEGTPTATIIVSVHNEAGTIEGLLLSCMSLDYPPEHLHVMIVLDHCTDGTAEAVELLRVPMMQAGLGISVVEQLPGGRGKSEALNLACALSSSDILVFTDANVCLERSAMRALVRWFSLPEIGGVCGRRLPQPHHAALSTRGDQVYWSYEAFVKWHEALLDSVVGADGTFYGIRRELYRPISGCADDLAVSLNVVRGGKRLAYARDAIGFESSTPRLQSEFWRKLRTQTCALPELLNASALFMRSRPVFAWMLLSHKLMRYIVPSALAGALVTSAVCRGTIYRLAFALQLTAYGLSVLLGLYAIWGRRSSTAAIPIYGLAAQAAAGLAPFRLLRARQRQWSPTPR